MSTPKQIITRPNAGDSHNDVRLYRVAENNLDMPDPLNGTKVGLLRVVPVWSGCIKYGYASEGGIGGVVSKYHPYSGLGFPDTNSVGCDVTVTPPPGWPGHDTPEKTRARVHAAFSEHYGEWFFDDFLVDEPGNGYSASAPPGLTYQFYKIMNKDDGDPDPYGDHVNITPSPDPEPRCAVFARTLQMTTDDHGIAAGDNLVIRFRYYDDHLVDPNPPQDYVRLRVPVVAQSGRTLSLGDGFPQDSFIDNYNCYVPNDNGSTAWGPAGQSIRWVNPAGNYDPRYYNPYLNAPPWRYSVYRYDPRPVFFLCEKNGSPIPIGAYVAVHENFIYENGLRLCWPLSLTRDPYWG